MSASTHAKRVLHREDDDAEQLFRSFNEERLDDLNAILLPPMILDQALGSPRIHAQSRALPFPR